MNTVLTDRFTEINAYLAPKGYVRADDNDPGLASLEKGQAAWYATTGTVVSVGMNEEGYIEINWSDGEEGVWLTTATLPWEIADAKLLARVIVAVK